MLNFGLRIIKGGNSFFQCSDNEQNDSFLKIYLKDSDEPQYTTDGDVSIGSNANREYTMCVVNATYFYFEQFDVDDVQILELRGIKSLRYFAEDINPNRISFAFEKCDFSSVEDMKDAFYGCDRIEKLDLSELNFSNVTNIEMMCRGMSNLTSIKLPDMPNVTNGQGAFWLCKNLQEFPQINLDSLELGGAMFERCESLVSFPQIDFPSLRGSYRKILRRKGGRRIYGFYGGMWAYCTSLKSFPNVNFDSLEYAVATWKDCVSLESFPQLSLPSVKELNLTWENCKSLTSFPLIDFHTATVFRNTWAGCSSITIFSKFDFSNATILEGVFLGCSSVKSFPDFDTSNATSIGGMFAYTNIEYAPFLDTSKVKTLDYRYNMYRWRRGGVFQGCKHLKEIPGWDFSNVKYFHIPSNRWLTGAFSGCVSLVEIPSGMSFENMLDGYNCFNGCTALKYVKARIVPSGEDINFHNFFKNCSNLECIQEIDTTNKSDTDGMFDGCDSLIAPNENEQQQILDGYHYINQNQCGA